MGAAADEAPGSMAAIIGFDQARIEALCAEARQESGARVDLANLNAPLQIVVSGDAAGVNALSELAKDAGAKRVVTLNVSGAWHSELMRSAVPRFAKFIEQAAIELPGFEVISNVEVQPYSSVEQIRRCLIASLRLARALARDRGVRGGSQTRFHRRVRRERGAGADDAQAA